MTLASIDDYTLRFGTPTDSNQISALLYDASSLVQKRTRQKIEAVSNEVITLDVGVCDYVLMLPERPVTAVTSVIDNGVALTVDTHYWWYRSGKLVRRGGTWTYGPRKVSVTYSHGFDPVEPWLVSLVCTMANRATKSWVADGIRSESFVDAYSVSYSAPAAGGTLVWVTDTEDETLLQLRAPQVR